MLGVIHLLFLHKRLIKEKIKMPDARKKLQIMNIGKKHVNKLEKQKLKVWVKSSQRKGIGGQLMQAGQKDELSKKYLKAKTNG